MSFRICATDGETKLIACMKAETETEAVKNFNKEWNEDGRLTITKVAQLGRRK